MKKNILISILLFQYHLIFCQTIEKPMINDPEISSLIESSNTKFRDGDYSGAINDFNQIIEKDLINCSWTYSQRAFYKGLNKDYYGSIADYTHAIENENFCQFTFNDDEIPHATLDVDLYGLYFSRGKAKMNIDDFIGAILDFNQSVKNKKYSEAFYERGNAKLFLQDYRGAISDYNTFLKLKNYSINNDIYFYRGCAKYELKDYSGALLDINMFLKKENEDALGYLQRGLIKVALNQKHNACMDFSKAGELGNEEGYKMIKKHCN
ncbi:MAG: hypothetical protein O9282_05900 [Flavobacterium sp.]|uniref:tetratricopeptide repeat protein n=1 Tax=Flavobacterium sp. TaxID=239 RepID=UPI0022C23796|nr:hypothetical protein [Flavobacterium sp.]MCZ8330826.1 hypothetical protein [Flavobacterium sp.]